MINGSDFFTTERYLRTRILLLISVGCRSWLRSLLDQRIGTSRACNDGPCHRSLHRVCITIILRNARPRASASNNPAPLDGAMRKNLRGRIRRLQFGVAFLALVFVYATWKSRDDPLLPRVVGASINLLFQFVLIQGIRRLQKLLR